MSERADGQSRCHRAGAVATDTVSNHRRVGVFVKGRRQIAGCKARQQRVLVPCQPEHEIVIVVLLAEPAAV